MPKPITRILVLFILSLSCNHRKVDTNEKENYASLKREIIGKWGYKGETTLEITTDSIYYLHNNTSYPYYFIKDTFFVKFPNSDTLTPFGKMSVSMDTLTWVDREGFKTFGYRVNN